MNRGWKFCPQPDGGTRRRELKKRVVEILPLWSFLKVVAYAFNPGLGNGFVWLMLIGHCVKL